MDQLGSQGAGKGRETPDAPRRTDGAVESSSDDVLEAAERSRRKKVSAKTRQRDKDKATDLWQNVPGCWTGVRVCIVSDDSTPRREATRKKRRTLYRREILRLRCPFPIWHRQEGVDGVDVFYSLVALLA